jgi:predicted methyltransferase
MVVAVALMAAPAAYAITPAQAVADTSRPAADTARDEARKPAEMLAFAKIKEGQTVVDIMPGGGYFTRLFSAMVGAKGKVYAFVPAEIVTRNPKAMEGLEALAKEPGRANVQPISHPFLAPAPATVNGTIDMIWTSQNYHDFKNNAAYDMAVFNKGMFNRLKKGGYYIVLDHSAPAGSGFETTKTLHRVDGAAVRKEVEAAGFVFDGESKVLANPADKRDTQVHDPALRGHTDQFVYRFRKP